MTDFATEFAQDFDSDSDGSINGIQEDPVKKVESEVFNNDEETLIKNIKQLIDNENSLNTKESLSRLDTTSIKDIKTVSNLLNLLESVLTKIDSSQDKQVSYEFLITINEFVSEITTQINLIFELLKSYYNKRFSELSKIITDPVEYSKTILILQNDLKNFDNTKLKQVISGEKVLVINMSILEASTVPLPDLIMDSIIESCNVLINLFESQKKIIQFISNKLSLFAPNLTNLLGSYCSVQLISYCGGLDKLASTPSCNIPSIGNKNSTKIGFGKNGINQKGVLYNTSLIQNIPESFQKQAMRILSGKLVLTARIDLNSSYNDGSFGLNTRKDFLQKIEKLMTPPKKVIEKALPLPIEKPSKKRGGKRFRKLKEKFQMTEIQKAQNRMMFGKEEDTVIDSFGEVIGLGFASKNSIVSTGKIRRVQNNKIKNNLTKDLNKRLKQIDNLEEVILNSNDSKDSVNENWFKRKAEDLLENDNTKKLK